MFSHRNQESYKFLVHSTKRKILWILLKRLNNLLHVCVSQYCMLSKRISSIMCKYIPFPGFLIKTDAATRAKNITFSWERTTKCLETRLCTYVRMNVYILLQTYYDILPSQYEIVASKRAYTAVRFSSCEFQ